MSFLHSHSEIGHIRIPSIPKQVQASAVALTTSFVVTFTTNPIDGNMLIVNLSGSLRGVTISNGPWNVLFGGPAASTFHLLWKICGPSEPTTYTFTMSGGFAGGYIMYEIQNNSKNDTIGTDLQMMNNPSATSINLNPFNIDCPSIAITFLQLIGSTDLTWNVVDNSFTSPINGGTFKASYRNYSALATSEHVTWSGGSSRITSGTVTVCRGKPFF